MRFATTTGAVAVGSHGNGPTVDIDDLASQGLRMMLAHPCGSTGPTCVIDTSDLADDARTLSAAIRFVMQRTGDRIDKFALVRKSAHPLFDIDYRFAQVFPSETHWSGLGIDLTGHCGHALLAGAAATAFWGWISHPVPGSRIRVRGMNDESRIVLETTGCRHGCLEFQYHHIFDSTPCMSLLPTGEPQTWFGEIPTTIICAGNPYVFVCADALGIQSRTELFSAGNALLIRLEQLRRKAAELVESKSRLFPKVCCVGRFDDGVAVRSVAVHGWHPGLALTGLIAAAAASVIPETLLSAAGSSSRADVRVLSLTTESCRCRAMTHLQMVEDQAFIDSITVSRKTVRVKKVCEVL